MKKYYFISLATYRNGNWSYTTEECCEIHPFEYQKSWPGYVILFYKELTEEEVILYKKIEEE